MLFTKNFTTFVNVLYHMRGRCRREDAVKKQHFYYISSRKFLFPNFDAACLQESRIATKSYKSEHYTVYIRIYMYMYLSE